ncbi:MAG: alcohol dehydrogenase catalytic domain-containing protein, partial [Candidatus Sericytochromatia bacterium]
MKALVLEGVNQNLELKSVDTPTINENEILVKIKSASFNRRDYWIRKGLYAGLKFPIILGSDGSGVVESSDNKYLIGKEVIINPSVNWGVNEKVQSKDFKILGLPEDGTFA